MRASSVADVPLNRIPSPRRQRRGPIFDYKTKNRSFYRTYKQLEALGIKNCKFHLLLLNPELQGVDPFDPNLTPKQIADIITECTLNIFYYLREVVRIEEQGGTTISFIMDRGTLASVFCFINSIDHYLMKPRQTGKTVGICAEMSWGFKFGSTNSEMMFVANKEKNAVKNLRTMKRIIGNLPPYLSKMGIMKIDNTGKKVRQIDNQKTFSEPVTNNQAMCGSRATTEESAEEVGRGFSQVYQFFDESEFTAYIDIMVKVSGMAFNTASRNAMNNGGNACRVFATTPGDLSSTKSCQSALRIVNSSTVWDEAFYDMPIAELKELIARDAIKKKGFGTVYIEYNHKQLGLDEKWFQSACKNVSYDVVKIRREILLERFSGNTKSPFEPLDIQELEENKLAPIETRVVGKIYDVLIYKKINKRRLHFITIDTSDGTGGDNYAITVMDPYELEVVMEFRNPYMTNDGLYDMVDWMIKNYIRNPLIIIEKNRSGVGVIDIFRNSRYRNRVYHASILNNEKNITEDALDDKGFIKQQMVNRKYYGINTTTTSRDLMMGILTDCVRFGKQYIKTQYLVDDVKNLILKNGKIQADAGEHDDSIMSWLLGMYVYYYGDNLEKFGFKKGALPRDIEESDDFVRLQDLYSNPSIKRQFPSMYEFYKSQVEPVEIAKRNDEEQQILQTGRYEPKKIGGIDTSQDNVMDVDDYVNPLLDEYNSDRFTNRWSNLNKSSSNRRRTPFGL